MLTLLAVLLIPLFLLYEIAMALHDRLTHKEVVLKKGDPDIHDAEKSCVFDTPGNVFDFNRFVFPRNTRVPCNTCNQYVWKDDTNKCGTFEYRSNPSTSGKCLHNPTTVNNCPFNIII